MIRPPIRKNRPTRQTAPASRSPTNPALLKRVLILVRRLVEYLPKVPIVVVIHDPIVKLLGKCVVASCTIAHLLGNSVVVTICSSPQAMNSVVARAGTNHGSPPAVLVPPLHLLVTAWHAEVLQNQIPQRREFLIRGCDGKPQNSIRADFSIKPAVRTFRYEPRP